MVNDDVLLLTLPMLALRFDAGEAPIKTRITALTAWQTTWPRNGNVNKLCTRVFDFLRYRNSLLILFIMSRIDIFVMKSI